MNRNIALAALFAAAVSGNVMASDDTPLDPTPFVSSQSRAEVQAELARFQMGGSNPWSDQYNPLATFMSKLSRETVTNAYLSSRSEVAALSGEDSGSSYLAMTRAQPGGAMLAGRPLSNAQ